ncbi:hypothetical protein BC826DRAFT_1108062 [Russula brevipes]|nr:hypothetical protein BC826DRAFT_1108062 [Russula brevipes]
MPSSRNLGDHQLLEIVLLQHRKNTRLQTLIIPDEYAYVCSSDVIDSPWRNWETAWMRSSANTFIDGIMLLLLRVVCGDVVDNSPATAGQMHQFAGRQCAPQLSNRLVIMERLFQLAIGKWQYKLTNSFNVLDEIFSPETYGDIEIFQQPGIELDQILNSLQKHAHPVPLIG